MNTFPLLFLELCILSASFSLQIFPRLGKPLYGVDTWRWLLYADEIRKNNGRLPDKVDKYVFAAPFNAPPLLLIMLARFLTRENAEKYNFLINPFFNILENILLFSFTWWLTGNGVAALIASFVFMFTPADIIENTDLNMRSLGKLCYQIAFVALVLFMWKGGLWLGCLFSLTVCLTLLAHRMSTQFLMMTTLGVALAFGQMLPPFYMVMGIVLAVILSKGFYLRVFNNHLSILMFWWRHQNQRFANMLTGESPPTSFRNMLWVFIKRLVLRNPYLFFIPFFIGGISLYSGVLLSLQTTLVLAVIMAIVTTFVPFLIFLGEGYRYVGLVGFQTALFVALFFADGTQRKLAFPCLFIASVASLFAIWGWIRKMKQPGNQGVTFTFSNDLKKLIAVMERGGKEYHFMSIPPVVDDAVAYFSENARVAFHDNGVALQSSHAYFPVIQDLGRFFNDLKIDFCFVNCTAVDLQALRRYEKQLGRICLEGDHFICYDVRSAA